MTRWSHVVLVAGLALGLSAITVGDASAQFGKDEAKCVDKANNSLSKVGKARGKEVGACIKNANKGKESDPAGCANGDAKGKVAKAKSKVTSCGGDIPIDKATAEAALDDNARAFADDVFGDLNSAGIVGAAKDDGKCQQATHKGGQAIYDEITKAFRSCKKSAMGKGAGPAVDPASLQVACLPSTGVPDGKGKIAKRVTKLGEKIGKKCGASDIPTLYGGGNCSSATDAASLSTCVTAQAKCRSCLAIAAADGLTSADCDTVDDGSANGSCGGGGAIGSHKCVFDAGSSITIETAALPLPPFAVNGSIDISCGTIDGGTGKAPCDCTLQSLDPFEIVAIGTVCVDPAASSCATGEIDCDGGNSLDIDVTSQHGSIGIGTCGDQASCASACAAHCGASTPANPACEGFCLGGPNQDAPCTNDSDCPGSNCPGKDAAPHTGECQCTCITTGIGPASPSGSINCEVGVNINVESTPPPDPCGNGDILIAVGEQCVPMTSTTATSVINDSNFTGGQTIPPVGPPATKTGVPGDCVALATSTTTGIQLVGYANFFDSTIGDLQSTLSFICQ
ncbi:MAG: hypothetical protein ACE5FG_09150 [Myxococcota bacterium]